MHQGRLGVDQALKLNLNPIKTEGSECIAWGVGAGVPSRERYGVVMHVYNPIVQGQLIGKNETRNFQSLNTSF